MVYKSRAPPAKRMTDEELAVSSERLAAPKKVREEKGGGEGGDHSMNDTASKKLSPEEIEKSADRLSAHRKPAKELKPIFESRKMDKEDEERSVQRLYDQSVRNNAQKKEMSLKKVLDNSPSGGKAKPLDPNDVSGLVDRLHERAVAERETALARSRDKLVPKKESQKLNMAEQTTVNDRLHNEHCAKITESKKKLFEKYILQVEPKTVKRSMGESAATGDRLSVRPGSQ